MTSPTYCTSCGHELGVGRFCTNCGRPVAGRHPEAAPGSTAPAAPTVPAAPAAPPPSGQAPPAARYPLYADAPPRHAPTTVFAPAPAGPPAPSPPRWSLRRPAWLPWLAVLVLLAVIGGVGAVLLLGSGDDRASDQRSSGQPTGSGDPIAGGDGGAGGEPAQPDSSGTGGPVEEPDADDVVDLTAGVSAEVPAIAPPSRDRQNRPVRFRAANMWDDKARTAWRMPGDGSGRTLSFDFDEDVVLTEVGMINGYAKIDGPTNWYTANRRIRTVQWEFDDGTRVTQELDDRQSLQTVDLGPVETRTVTLHLLGVSAPADGGEGRDFTAISEVRFLGVR